MNTLWQWALIVVGWLVIFEISRRFRRNRTRRKIQHDFGLDDPNHEWNKHLRDYLEPSREDDHEK